MALSFKSIIDGFEAYDGIQKVAVIRSRSHDGISFKRVIKKRHFKDDEHPDNIQLRGANEEIHETQYTDLPPEQWEIRFTSGHGSGAQVQEIMAHKPDYDKAVEARG
jgi:hypothetical protein